MKKKVHTMKDACVPCALQYVSKIDEETVLRACSQYGFVEGGGMTDDQWLAAAKMLGLKLRKFPIEQMKLSKFLKQNKLGLFLMNTFDHLFVVDNGIIFDPRNKKPPGLSRIIKDVWRVK